MSSASAKSSTFLAFRSSENAFNPANPPEDAVKFSTAVASTPANLLIPSTILSNGDDAPKKLAILSKTPPAAKLNIAVPN